MESGNKLRGLFAALLAVGLTAVLVFFGNGLTPHWPLMWLAPLPVLLYALRSSARNAGVAAFVAWLAGCLNLWGYFLVLGTPGVAWAATFGLEALVFAAAVLLMRALARRGAMWSAWLALPAVWVTFEYVRNLLWPHGSAASLAYSQLNFLPFLELASLAGPWGMGFVLLLFPAGLAMGIHLWGSSRMRAVRVLGATAGLVAAVLIFGAVRLAMRQPGPEVQVGLVASDVRPNVWTAKAGTATQRLFAAYGAGVRELAARGAKVVVLPEKLGTVADPDVASADAVLQKVADEAGVTVVAGVGDEEPTVAYNQARVYTPRGVVETYNKEHLLPPFENRFAPGTALRVLHPAGMTWGVAICKDMDFTNPARKNGQAGAGLMLVPGWDFDIDGFWHGHIAVMRGVEDGFSVVRAAKDGFLTVSDNRGRIVAEAASGSAPFTTLLADVPAGHDRTLFQLWGDWFAWYAIALLALVLVRLLLGLRRTA
jgi:apolipoprotein N-acyltransferase